MQYFDVFVIFVICNSYPRQAVLFVLHCNINLSINTPTEWEVVLNRTDKDRLHNIIRCDDLIMQIGKDIYDSRKLRRRMARSRQGSPCAGRPTSATLWYLTAIFMTPLVGPHQLLCDISDCNIHDTVGWPTSDTLWYIWQQYSWHCCCSPLPETSHQLPHCRVHSCEPTHLLLRWLCGAVQNGKHFLNICYQ